MRKQYVPDTFSSAKGLDKARSIPDALLHVEGPGIQTRVVVTAHRQQKRCDVRVCHSLLAGSLGTVTPLGVTLLIWFGKEKINYH